MTKSEFLAQVKVIAGLHPRYRLGRKGDDGYCDCIGLIIGAVERCGGEWGGIHGSNWAARNRVQGLSLFRRASALSVGELVFKGRQEGESGYDLPDRYSSHPDQIDYYHVGVVLSVSPLVIVHCTSPGGIKRDTRLRDWEYRGALDLLEPEPMLPAEDQPLLRRTDRGEAVRDLQRLLRERGFALEIDGIFGPMTRECVMTFQGLHGLEQDGIVGPLTWAALLEKREV